MIKRPNLYTHMAKWGMLSGTILAVFLITFLSTLSDPSSLIALIFPPLWFLGFILGGIPGMILGAIEAAFLNRNLSNTPLQFTQTEMHAHRDSAYRTAGFVPIVAHVFLSLFVGTIAGFAGTGFAYFLLFGIPTLLASLASIYAVHRYMFRLRLYGMRSIQEYDYEPAKNDYKVNRLVDAPYETAYYDDDDHNGTYLVQG